MARSDWYGGIKWVGEQHAIPASVAVSMVLEAGEASDRMRETTPQAPPPPARNDLTSGEYQLWLALVRRFHPDQATQMVLRARAAAAEIEGRRS